jgi:hypothetical protein
MWRDVDVGRVDMILYTDADVERADVTSSDQSKNHAPLITRHICLVPDDGYMFVCHHLQTTTHMNESRNILPHVSVGPQRRSGGQVHGNWQGTCEAQCVVTFIKVMCVKCSFPSSKTWLYARLTPVPVGEKQCETTPPATCQHYFQSMFLKLDLEKPSLLSFALP